MLPERLLQHLSLSAGLAPLCKPRQHPDHLDVQAAVERRLYSEDVTTESDRVLARIEESRNDPEFMALAETVLEENAELFRRLAET